MNAEKRLATAFPQDPLGGPSRRYDWTLQPSKNTSLRRAQSIELFTGRTNLSDSKHLHNPNLHPSAARVSTPNTASYIHIYIYISPRQAHRRPLNPHSSALVTLSPSHHQVFRIHHLLFLLFTPGMSDLGLRMRVGAVVPPRALHILEDLTSRGASGTSGAHGAPEEARYVTH